MSENDVFVLPNTRLARKRSTKKPQRYNESLDAEDINVLDSEKDLMPSKSKRFKCETPSIPVPPPVKLFKYDKRFINMIQHINVVLPKLPELEVEPWCMIHCLYKCFCKGQSVIGKPFSFEKIKDSNQAATHWEIAPARRAHYTFDRESNENVKQKKPIDQKPLVITIELGAARTRSMKKDDYTHRSLDEIRNLRHKCEEIEFKQSAFLQKRIKECYSKFKAALAQRRQINYTINHEMQETLVDTNTINAVKKSQSQSKQPNENSVDKLNRLITESMRNVCNLQRNHVLDLNTKIYELSYVSWHRIISSYINSQIYIWHTKLADDNVALFVTLTNEKPRFLNVIETKQISEVPIEELPLIAQLIRKNFEKSETIQLGNLTK